ncbi:MAG: UvrB/UvrC motif-containing protein [Tissierellia bacterium]|nr:UvrB/UvrC motif-containing protein [Tissierellia bacterium]
MLCENCGLRKAVISYAKIEEDSHIEVHLCQECMEKKLREDLHNGSYYEDGVASLIENMLQFFNVGMSRSRDLICSHCGTSWLDFRKVGKLGCENCYKEFETELYQLIENMQGSTTHKGKIAKNADPIVFQERELEDLRYELEKAVESEEYEKAAVLRDKINDMLNLSETEEE